MTVLVQSEAKGRRLAAKYPRVHTLVGNMGEYDKVEAASRDADLVVNTSPDITHDEGIRAILRGLHEGRARGGPSKSCYYIHTSGASLIWDDPEGSPDARWWDDVADLAELSALKEKHTHAVTDRIVREAAGDVRVAIVSPGFVGGLSPSVEHPTPITTPAIMTTARAFGSGKPHHFSSCSFSKMILSTVLRPLTGFQIAKGENVSAWIHVMDLANMFMILINDALASLAGAGEQSGRELWGAEAYYFGVGENIAFGDFMRALVPVLHARGVITSPEIASVDVVQAARISLAGPGNEYDPLAPSPPPDSWAMHIAIMYGVNMRILASRMGTLGWKPEAGSVVETFDEVITEYLRLEQESK